MATEDHDPAWLSGREETPLMGTGSASLQDPEVPPDKNSVVDDLDDDESQEESQEEEDETVISKVSKSSRSKNKKNKKNKKVSASDWHEDEPAGETVRTVRGPMKNCVLHFFHWFEGLAIISCLGVLITQILPLVVVSSRDLGFLQVVLRAYVSLFSIAFILVELRVPLGFLKKAHLLQTYFSRGFLYTFLGVVGMEEAYSGRIEEAVTHATDQFHVSWAPLFMQISSWLVFAIGCIYMISGICCLQILRDKLDKDHKEKLKEYEELD